MRGFLQDSVGGQSPGEQPNLRFTQALMILKTPKAAPFQRCALYAALDKESTANTLTRKTKSPPDKAGFPVGAQGRT
ncbi:MAG: hypothetical protein C9356_13535 [Oleiphilus sp.]|nr:MAG: hypothetical protein C9356_13535 [Oleiphilus sp.]